MAELTCPKCHGPMRAYERNGVTVDSCTECRGIFLDRGELERLIDAEGSYYESNPGGRDRRHYDDDDDYRLRERSSSGSLGGMLGSLSGSGHHGHGKHHHHGYYKKRKKKSFLEELFD